MEFYSDFHIVGKVVFLEDGVLSRNVKKERKVSKPHKNGALTKFESIGNRKNFILRKVL